MDRIEVKLADLDAVLERVAATRPTESKLFDTYQKLVLLFVSFLLTGVVGAGLTYFFNVRAEEKERTSIAAGELFKDVVRATNQRLRAMSSLAQTYSLVPDDRASKLSPQWDSYTSLLDDWNNARDYRRAMVRILYGEAAYQEERNIHYAFRQIGETLGRLPRDEPVSADAIKTASSVEEQLRLLQNKIQSFYFQPAADLTTARVGQHRRTAKAEQLDWDNKDTLSRYLQQ